MDLAQLHLGEPGGETLPVGVAGVGRIVADHTREAGSGGCCGLGAAVGGVHLVGGLIQRAEDAVDVGGGYGRLCILLENYADQVTLAEPSQQQLDIAADFLKNHPEIKRELMQADDLKFKDGVWRSEARGGNKKWVKLAVGPANGKVYEADAPSKLTKDEIGAKLATAGYQNVKDVKFDKYDPEAAKKILAANNVTSIDLWASDRSRPYNPNFQRAAELIQADWAKVGVTAKITTEEWTKYREDGKKKDRPGAFQIGWSGDNGDPDNFFATLFSCSAIGVSNYSSWCNKDFENDIQKAKTTADMAERTKFYEDAQKVFAADAPAFLFAHSQVYVVADKKVSGFVQDPLGMHRFDGVDVTE